MKMNYKPVGIRQAFSFALVKEADAKPCILLKNLDSVYIIKIEILNKGRGEKWQINPDHVKKM